MVGTIATTPSRLVHVVVRSVAKRRFGSGTATWPRGASPGRTPTREQMLQSADLFESVGRGECRFAVIRRDGAPSEVLFVGYSYD
jgi:hypothetical protein